MAPSENSGNDAEENRNPASTEDGHFTDDRELKKPRCVGRCDMELGDVTHHNVQVIDALDLMILLSETKV